MSPRAASDVCLVNMPFVALERPSIALGLLQAVLDREGISSVALYENLRFADTLGLHEYRLIEDQSPESLLGDWVFSGVAFPDSGMKPVEYLAGLFRPEVGRTFQKAFGVEPADAISIFEEAWARASRFVDESVERVLAAGPRIVGCTSTFQQHVASLALLRRVREADPRIVTLLGGANCETKMGRANHRSFEWVDFVVSGEADSMIGDLCRAIFEQGRQVRLDALPAGVFGPEHRRRGYPTGGDGDGVPRAVTRDLADLPTPDYDDYFAALESSTHRSRILPGLPVEGSRGCWWGQREHCTFCGLNGTGMSFRPRPVESLAAELAELEDRYGHANFEMVDNILDMRLFDTLLPALAEEEPPPEIFCEIKANLKRRQVRLLRDAGITWVQPGIESLSTAVLSLMRKGSTATTNVQLLKWCREFGVYVVWNMLYGFPGEALEWYESVIGWLPLVRHLQPPSSAIPIRIDRYSPYHSTPEAFGLALVPNRHYAQLYPLPEPQLSELAYFFEATGGPWWRTARGDELPPTLTRLGTIIEEWRCSFYSGLPELLCVEEAGDGLTVLDHRACATASRHDLEGLAARAYAICDEAPTFTGLVRRLSEVDAGKVTETAVRRVVNDLRERRLLLALDDRLLSLAVRGEIPSLPQKTGFPGGVVLSSPADLEIPKARRGRRRAVA